MCGERRKERQSKKAREFLALDGVSIRHRAGGVMSGINWIWRVSEQWAILGPDGSGKSLLVDALLGRASLLKGEIRGPFGENGAEEVAPEAAIGIVSLQLQRELALGVSSFYQSRWHSGLEEGSPTVADFLSSDHVEGRNPYQVGGEVASPKEFDQRVRRLVQELELASLLTRKLHQLSNGELRKTLLAHSLLRQPRLLILDDVNAGLDVGTRGKLKKVVASLMAGSLRVLILTSRPEEIPAATTHLLLMDRHKVVATGSKRLVLKVWRERFGLRDRAAAGRRRARQGRKGSVAQLGKPLVELRKVTVKADCDRTILRDITWTIRQGQCWALTGPNGAGKTTLLNLIQGDHPQVYAQDVRLFGRQADSTLAVWRGRQATGWFSPELHQHYPVGWPAIEVVGSGFFNSLGLHEPLSCRQRAAALLWLQDLGLARRAHAAFGDFSFAEQRLILLARSAVKDPQLLILDEVCQGLDRVQRERLLAAVDRMVARTGAGLLFVTHRAKEIPACITHWLRIERGRVVGVVGQ
jgi:molybdate transport system ATP-binding protein